MPNSFSSPARSFSIAALSPKPLSMRLAPSFARARAMATPMPDVEPVTSAVLPLSMKTLVDWGAGNVLLFLLRCNIYVRPGQKLVYPVRLIDEGGQSLGQKSILTGGVPAARPRS